MKAPLVRTLTILLAGLTFVATSRANEINLRAASFQPANVSFAKHFYRWVNQTNGRCDGQLEIHVVSLETIPSELQWYELQNGRIDMYYGPANYYRGALPHADVLSLGRNDPAEQRRNGAWEILNALHNKYLNAWYLTSLSAGVQFFVYTTRPAEGGRFQGARIRAVPLYDGFLRSLGAEPVFMPASDVKAALEKGDIDGYGWPLWTAGLDWEQHVKFRHGPGFLNTATPVLVNLDKWNQLTDAQRQCLTDMAVWVESEWPKWRTEEDAKQLELLTEAGIKYIDLGAEFGRRAEAIYWAMLEKAEPDYVQQVKPLFDSRE